MCQIVHFYSDEMGNHGGSVAPSTVGIICYEISKSKTTE